MKREIAMIAFVLLGMGMTASAQFGKKINLGKALQAGKDVVSAVTLSDADIANMSKEYMAWMDTHNPLTKPDTEYPYYYSPGGFYLPAAHLRNYDSL